jgi:hypothetical protein
MKTSAVLLLLTFVSGPAFASPKTLAMYSKLDIPVFGLTATPRPTVIPMAAGRMYIGSDKSYAAEPKEVQVAGRTLTLGLVAAALCHPLAPVMAAGFLLIGAYNAHQLIATLNAPPKRRSEWSFLWTRSSASDRLSNDIRYTLN